MGIEVIKRNLKGEHLCGWECGNLMFYGEMSNVWLGTVVVKLYSQKGKKMFIEETDNPEKLPNKLFSPIWQRFTIG